MERLLFFQYSFYSFSTSKNVKKAKYFLKNVDKDLKRIREKQANYYIYYHFNERYTFV